MTPHVWQVRVYYEDTDLAGIVYHANYLKFIERARSEMVRDLGIDQARLRAEGRVFAVTHLEATFRAPARYDDVLVIETSVQRLTPVRFVLDQTVLRDGAPLFIARVTVACMDLEARPKRLDPGLQQGLAAQGFTKS
ncbi:tol-pal system-associated acyl-CoA thioesterase [Jannaschia pagri]|uniref:Tol-pal system-associated acyl-CoA thioesterase n=1 Tax=Jannaschia pagri TaxID=2829797 RepID=A0ABQ4NHX0_9RHOB|nr:MULTISPECIES: tol-pal system-associated acyl-CoA thioesterase [unclassified Jannaschia]GIT89886.1 tol-pal system-associated acyl-CoA thioesterase [Jannaschia sp. AI_61]GIT94007.1 tol-pal system-associated acyl-CoA thioesterase [Jannaschia sp. AI_62]